MAVSVVPVPPMRVTEDALRTVVGLVSVIVPVAGVVGLTVIRNVKVFASMTVTVCRPLYSVSVAPEIVTLWPVVKPCAVAVAVTVPMPGVVSV